ncbi:hypothetical protein [Parasitella parasitica]|uniref:Sulfotransferase domain-containing protein n=1 Tax=Parasitella parasitica TaxID=35722 RepID=A0A0B7MQ57_9FUNG|nr:hypothetical protein [Parasitella parasitica]
MTIEVIGAGLGRTGTSSFCTAMDILGYKCHHMKKLLTETSNQDSKPFYSAFLSKKKAELEKKMPELEQEIANLEEEMANLNAQKNDLDTAYEGYDAATDWLGAYFYEELLARNPHAKVVLTERPFEDWYKSVKNTIHLAVTEKEESKPGSPYYFFGQLCRKIILDGKIVDKEAFSDKESIKKYYDNHTQKIKDIVPKDQLYCLKIGEGWEGLCQFLGKPVPEEPYPNLNSSAFFKKRFDVKATDTTDPVPELTVGKV